MSKGVKNLRTDIDILRRILATFHNVQGAVEREAKRLGMDPGKVLLTYEYDVDSILIYVVRLNYYVKGLSQSSKDLLGKYVDLDILPYMSKLAIDYMSKLDIEVVDGSTRHELQAMVPKVFTNYLLCAVNERIQYCVSKTTYM